MFAFSTIFQACNVEFTQLAFIENREYPGGPAAYENDFWNIPVDAVGNVLFVLTNWMTDSILVCGFSSGTFTNVEYPPVVALYGHLPSVPTSYLGHHAASLHNVHGIYG